MNQSTLGIRDMFDALVPEYDRFNRVSSLGQDVFWRRELTRHFPDKSYVLDVGTGTGDLAKEFALRGDHVIGVDFSEKMIEAAQKKMKSFSTASFHVAQANDLPFEPRTFDGVVSAFVIRNLHHGKILSQSFREFFRVLKPGAPMVHLELARPPKGLLQWGHKAYLNTLLPIIGWLNFGHRWPKNYLAQTIENFPEAKKMCQQIRWAGFERVGYYPLSGGIAGLYRGVRC